MKIAVLGTGNMGKALIRGLNGLYRDDIGIVAYDQVADAYASLDDVQIVPPDTWGSMDPVPRAVFLVVKPNDMEHAIQQCSSIIGKASDSILWISFAAGITISFLQEAIGKKAHICRVMPNTPALIGQGISAYTTNEYCTEDDRGVVDYLLKACGKAIAVPEKAMHVVTGLSGSGPAYVYLFIEALIEAGITNGLPYPVARECAVQTVIGAAKMVEQTGQSPGMLKTSVMSPGGTTVQGLKALEGNAFKYACIEAVTKATQRSKELETNQ